MAKQAKSRDDYAKECPAYGWTEEGGTGFDASTEECTACLGQEPEMAAACKAEAEAGQAAEDDAQEAALKAEKEEDGKAATEKAERAAAEAAEKKARKEAAKAAPKTPAELTTPLETPEPTETLAEPPTTPPKPTKPPQAKDTRQTTKPVQKKKAACLGRAVVDTILTTRRVGKFTREQIFDAVSAAPATKDRTKSAIDCQIGHAIIFGVRFGLLSTFGGGGVEWIEERK